ncbi:agarase [Maribacter vaceletii]|uniref:Agarase n=1 Tax=Maribacter vaceletii TaxID=1206816 RepID=A0A495EBQ2_9FLAO|nr:T9SS type A sorting domain-containing protein [Maribacter vaceletii]RKR14318.1 agarase [Maribacter vaceletii]
MNKLIIGVLLCFMYLPFYAQVQVDVNLNVKHTVGNISEFDRSKFITIHANQVENEWDGDNFVTDLRDDFLNGYDVYLGRNTGSITWNLNNIGEDPIRSGFADPNEIVTKGSNTRNNYASKTDLHSYESRKANHVMAAQLHPFWTGESQRATSVTGWELANATATGEYMGRFFNEFHGGNGEPIPKWIEVINEPAYEELGGKSNFTNSLQEVADFHVEVADAIRVQNPNLKIGGYTVAFPDFETGDFQRWINRDKLFIDVAGEKMDFWSWHLYDFPVFGGKKDLRSGSNLEATFDMHDQYSLIKLGETKPYVISEYGSQTHDLRNEQWSPYRDWLFMAAQNGQMMSYMERPNDIAIAIPFTIVKAEWGYNSTTGIPYVSRLMRKANEPASYTGEWVYTERVKFYDLWKNVKGTRIDTKATDLDIQVDAYIDGNKGYVILNNLEFSAATIDLNVFDNYNVAITSILKRHLTLSGNIPVLEEESVITAISSVELGSQSTMILEYTFDNDIIIDETSDEVKYFADSYLQPIQANQAVTFNINGVAKPTTYGEAVLRVSIGRDHGSVLKPVVTVNNVDITVPEDWRGYDQAQKNRFFGTLEIPVAYDVLNTNNVISVAFPDAGGHVSSVAMQVFNFSSNIREFTPEKLPTNNYTIKAIDATCNNQDNGMLSISTIVGQNYNAVVSSAGYNESFNFSNNLSVENLKVGSYTIVITLPSFPDYKMEFSVQIREPESLTVSSKLTVDKNAVFLNLKGGVKYFVALNGKEIQTGANEIELALEEGINKLKVTTDKNCQGVYEETIFIDKSYSIYPNPVKEELSIVVTEKLRNSSAYVYDITGKLILRKEIDSTENSILVNGLGKGVYIIVFKRNKEKVGASKFVVE